MLHTNLRLVHHLDLRNLQDMGVEELAQQLTLDQ